MKHSVNYQNALNFVKEKHSGQMRASNVPTWRHLVHVSLILNFLLEQTREGSVEERNIIYLSALAHDVLEDTDATKDEVEKIFGKQGLELVEGMTNTESSEHSMVYVEQVRDAKEAVRLIKLSDLYDNISSVVHKFNTFELHWVTSYFLPIVTPMRKVLSQTKFIHYKKTAELLSSMVEAAAILLDEEVSHAQKK